MQVSTAEFKKGLKIQFDGQPYTIVDFQHVKPGKGGAFVRTKLKRTADGAVIDKTFRAGEKFRPIRPAGMSQSLKVRLPVPDVLIVDSVDHMLAQDVVRLISIGLIGQEIRRSEV